MSDEIISMLNCNYESGFVSKTSNTTEQSPSLSVVLGDTVCYIVGAVLINEKNEVLLIQEAKPSCRGTWYLPAGRVEPNETLENAVKREVLEEAGLQFQPSGIICVEENRARWIRFIFAGRVTGGMLKTLDDADSESLQAKWWGELDSVQLRCRDILRSIKHAEDYYTKQKSKLISRNLIILPQIVPYEKMYIQTVLLLNISTGPSYLVLMHKDTKGSPLLPVSCFHLHETVLDSISRIVNACFVPENGQIHWKPKVIGLLGVEHEGSSALNRDGLCLNILATVEKSNSEKLSEKDIKPCLNSNLATWHEIDAKSDLYKFLVNEQWHQLYIPLISLFR